MKRKLIRRNKIKYDRKLAILKIIRAIHGDLAKGMGIPVVFLTGDRAVEATQDEIDRYVQSVRDVWGIAK